MTLRIRSLFALAVLLAFVCALVLAITGGLFLGVASAVYLAAGLLGLAVIIIVDKAVL